MFQSDSPTDKKWQRRSTVFALCLLLLGAFLNYRFTNSTESDPTGIVAALLLWVLLFLPLVVLPWRAAWSPSDIGFAMGWKTVSVSALILVIVVVYVPSGPREWPEAAVEAFARTGEEVFFRGFLFTLICRLAHKQRWPWLWAVAGSSLAFALIHTHMLHTSSLPGELPGSAVSRAVGLLNAAVILTLIRWATGSILPGALVHSASNGTSETIPYVLALYATGCMWSKMWEVRRTHASLAMGGAAQPLAEDSAGGAAPNRRAPDARTSV